jgi:hypothetical protein
MNHRVKPGGDEEEAVATRPEAVVTRRRRDPYPASAVSASRTQ